MRYPRVALALAAAGCVLAIAAAPALGMTKKEFYGTPIGAKTKGAGVGEQRLTFGAVKIFCKKAIGKGLLGASPSPVFNSSIRFSECHTEAKIGSHPIELATRFLTPLVLEYHNNGFVETGSETVEEEGTVKVAGGEVELIINGGPKFKCHIKWPEQTLPSKAIKHPEEEFTAVAYKNVEAPHKITAKFPEGLQDQVLFEQEIKAIKFTYEGEPCEEWGKEGGPEAGGGKYVGNVQQSVAGGDLEFRSAEEEPF